EGKSGDARVTVAFELDEFDDALDGCAVAHLLAAHSREEQHLGQGIGADACVPPGQEVVEHRHLRKQLAVLERACESEPSNLVPRAAGDKVATKTDLPLAAVDTAHAIEHAGLAGAVRTDQREQLACRHGERHAVEHGEAAEAQSEAVDFELSHTISACGDIASPRDSSCARRS